MKKASPPIHAEASQSRINDTSTEAQRTRLLQRLRIEPIDTIAARDELNVMAPAPRIKELRERGHPIKTHRITRMDEHGRMHRGVALYYLGTEPANSAEVAP